ncbi:MAG: single-stranded DNA-binding protein [Patescibacteria group bacterium]|nr:single-stranded DNA-binding protein [Patescibacteria group bacterium]MDE2014990.1 single-stranded DNA-binding protein [Patescibacteria group bacterium]MDE2226419.1 single-stranded DNA-binding protein [Patescibacteria group bacterium]
MNLNKVFLIGRLTADPQLRTTAGGQSVASFSLATNRVWTDKSGAKQESTEFHNIVVWGRQAEITSQFLTKGSTVMIEGRLQTRSWQDKQGQSRKTTDIVAERVQFGPRPQGGARPVNVAAKIDSDAAAEEIPTINLEEEGEVKPEDLPF